MVLNTNAPEGSVQDVLDETAHYYVLGFQPASPATPGAHAVKVTVTRQHVTVVARTEWDAK